MRLFVALNFPPPVREALWAATARLRDLDLPVKWVRGEAVHLTLKFLGDVADEREPELAAALTSAGALHAVRLGEGPVHYESATGEHQHAVCQVCNGVLHIEHDVVRELEDHLEQLHRFRTVRTEVLVVGVCDTCARARGHGHGGRHRTL